MRDSLFKSLGLSILPGVNVRRMRRMRKSFSYCRAFHLPSPRVRLDPFQRIDRTLCSSFIQISEKPGCSAPDCGSSDSQQCIKHRAMIHSQLHAKLRRTDGRTDGRAGGGREEGGSKRPTQGRRGTTLVPNAHNSTSANSRCLSSARTCRVHRDAPPPPTRSRDGEYVTRERSTVNSPSANKDGQERRRLARTRTLAYRSSGRTGNKEAGAGTKTARDQDRGFRSRDSPLVVVVTDATERGQGRGRGRGPSRICAPTRVRRREIGIMDGSRKLYIAREERRREGRGGRRVLH